MSLWLDICYTVWLRYSYWKIDTTR